MQIIARDKRSIDLIVKELTDSNGVLGSSYHYRVLPNTSKLWVDIQEIPPNVGHTPVRLNMIAQHTSGRIYTASIFERDGLRSSSGIQKCRALLDRTLNMYKKGKLKGDLVFHKTAHAGCRHSSDNWPVKLDSKNGSEHWYITGVTNWILTMRAENELLPAPVIEGVTSEGIEEYKRWCVEVGRADRKQVEKIHHNEGIHYGRYHNRIRRYVKRVELINLLKDTIDLSYPTGIYGLMSWMDYIQEGDIPRFGAWCYKNGRLYSFSDGPSELEHRIKIHANRKTDLADLFIGGGII